MKAGNQKIAKHFNPDLLDLDDSLKIEDLRYISEEDRFKALMESRGIELLDEYQGADKKIKFRCNICEYSWKIAPKVIRSTECPKCMTRRHNEKSYDLHWKRSQKIIEDKQGKIGMIPNFNRDIQPTMKDEFVLKCHKNHSFASSHAKLYRDIWCPICGKIRNQDGGKLTSSATYQNKMSLENKEKRYRQVAALKGMRVTTSLQADGTYLLKCNVCKRTILKTPKQILENVYLCPKRCIKGVRTPLNALANWEWKDDSEVDE